MKAITLLGSTGSIGTQTLDILAQYPEQFRLVGLAAGRNVEMLAAQIRQFRPSIVAICVEDKLPQLKEAIADLDPTNRSYSQEKQELQKLPVMAMPKLW
jgi:1-deoxy-D-xylulose-5-phosphate reductoisomerase